MSFSKIRGVNMLLNRKGGQKGVLLIVAITAFLFFLFDLLIQYGIFTFFAVPQIVYSTIGLLLFFSILLAMVVRWSDASGVSKGFELLFSLTTLYFFVLPFLDNYFTALASIPIIYPTFAVYMGLAASIDLLIDALKMS